MIHVALLAAVLTSPVASPVPAVPISGMYVRAGTVLDVAAWARLPHATTKAADHDGRLAEFTGVRLADAIRDAGAPVGDALRGEAARAYVIVSASDGYAAIFTLAELDTAEPRCAPLVVDSRDGVPLASDVGPVRIVAPCDHTHARWVRSVTKLTVVMAAKG